MFSNLISKLLYGQSCFALQNKRDSFFFVDTITNDNIYAFANASYANNVFGTTSTWDRGPQNAKINMYVASTGLAFMRD